MKVEAGRALGSLDPQRIYQQLENPAVKPSFADSLKSALSEVNALQTQRDAMVNGMVSGKVSEVHEIMTAAEEAKLAFELVLEVRNRLLESYQELMRMQI